MGILKSLIGAKQVQIVDTGLAQSITDIQGSSHTIPLSSNSTELSVNYTNYYNFLVKTTGTTYTVAGKEYLFPYASSDSNIPESQTSITNQIGACSIAFTRGTNGWSANITITSNAEATVNSLLFTKLLVYYSGSWNNAETLLFVYIFDQPITLNAENNYTANLTMSIAFD